jgi:hypothetical protein
MSQSILDIVEESLLNIATRYKELSSDPSVSEADLKGFDEQLNDIMDRYNKLKGLQSTFTADELQIKLNEFETLYDDLVLKINNGFFKGADGKSLTFDMLTSEQKQELKGADGKSLTFDILTPEQKQELKGADGKSLTFDILTPEQKEELKGADGKSLTFDILTPEQKEELKGADGKSLTFDMLTPEQKEELKGADGKSLTFDMLTPEQKEELKGANGLSAYEVALNNGFDGSETQWLDSLKSSSSSGGGSSLALPIAITDVENLQEWMTSYQNSVSSLQQSLNGGTIGSVNINQLNGNFNSLSGKMESVMGALFGIQKEDDETGNLITIQEGLFEKFEKLYKQVNPTVGG